MAMSEQVAALLSELENNDIRPDQRAEIGERLAQIGDPRPGVGVAAGGLPGITWMPVAGVHRKETVEYRRYTGPHEEVSTKDEEVEIAPFYIARYPITNAQFAVFAVADDGFQNDRWWNDLPGNKGSLQPPSVSWGNHPRDNITWIQAVGFCRWLTAQGIHPDDLSNTVPYDPQGVGRITQFSQRGWIVRLPTYLEWQLAAADDRTGYRYPWGAEFDVLYANTREAGLGRPVAVGIYPNGISPTGAYDMSGNVQEWTLSLGMNNSSHYALFGGGYLDGEKQVATHSQTSMPPDKSRNGAGFRSVLALPFEGKSYQPLASVSRQVVNRVPL